MMIGHSIGEYTAACMAGVLSPHDALHLVIARARRMQSVPRGSMLSVALSGEALFPRLPQSVDVAAVNAPDQCVISGSTDVISQMELELTQDGVSCRRLRTSHAFHSRMMDSVLAPFAGEFAGVQMQPATVPYISNVSGDFVSTSQNCLARIIGLSKSASRFFSPKASRHCCRLERLWSWKSNRAGRSRLSCVAQSRKLKWSQR